MKNQKTRPTIKIYQAVFDCALPQQMQKALTNLNPWSNVLKEKNWSLQCGNYFDKKWDKVFPFMISAYCKQIYFNWCVHEKILMDISRINFTQLKQLYLNGNNIVSIEQLGFMSMLCLTNLYLNNNHITNISALNKCSWTQLKRICLDENNITQILIQRTNIWMGSKDEQRENEKMRYYWRVDICESMNASVKLGVRWQISFLHKQIRPSQRVSKCIEERLKLDD